MSRSKATAKAVKASSLSGLGLGNMQVVCNFHCMWDALGSLDAAANSKHNLKIADTPGCRLGHSSVIAFIISAVIFWSKHASPLLRMQRIQASARIAAVALSRR